MNCVVDASVAVGVFVVQPWSTKALMLFDLLSQKSPPVFYVPDVFYSEVLGSLRKYAMHKESNYDDLERDVRMLERLALNVVSTRQLIVDAARISLANRISSYDSLYLALSRRLGLPIITADARLVGATQGKNFDVRLIEDVN